MERGTVLSVQSETSPPQETELYTTGAATSCSSSGSPRGVCDCESKSSHSVGTKHASVVAAAAAAAPPAPPSSNNSGHAGGDDDDDDEFGEYCEVSVMAAATPEVPVTSPRENALVVAAAAAVMVPTAAAGAAAQSVKLDETPAGRVDSTPAIVTGNGGHSAHTPTTNSNVSLHALDDALVSTIGATDGTALVARFDASTAQLIQQVVPNVVRNSLSSTLSQSDTFNRLLETTSAKYGSLSTTLNTHSSSNNDRHSSLQMSSRTDSGGSGGVVLSLAGSSYAPVVPSHGSGIFTVRADGAASRVCGQLGSSICSTPLPHCVTSPTRSFSVVAPSISGDEDAESAELRGAFRAAACIAPMLSGGAALEGTGFSETFGSVTETVYSAGSTGSTEKVLNLTGSARRVEDKADERGSNTEGLTGSRKATLRSVAHAAVGDAAAIYSGHSTQSQLRQHDRSGSSNKKNSNTRLSSPPDAPIPLTQPVIDPAGAQFMMFVAKMSGAKSPPLMPYPGTMTPSPLPKGESGVDDTSAGSYISNDVCGSATLNSMPKLSHTATLVIGDCVALSGSRNDASGENASVTSPINSLQDTGGGGGDENGDSKPDASAGKEAPVDAVNIVEPEAPQMEKVKEYEDCDDDDFGDFVEIVPQSAADATPTPAPTATGEECSVDDDDEYEDAGTTAMAAHNPKEDQQQRQQRSVEQNALSSTLGASDTSGGVAVLCSKTVRFTGEAPSIVESPPANVWEEYPEEWITNGTGDSGSGEAEEEEEEAAAAVPDDSAADEDAEWAAFTGAFSVPLPIGRGVSVGATASSPKCADGFVFSRDVDTALFGQRLHDLVGCVVDTNSTVEELELKVNSGDAQQQQQQRSRRSQLTAVMEALSFTQLTQHGDPEEELCGVGGSFVRTGDFAGSFSYMGSLIAPGGGLLDGNEETPQLLTLTLSTCDPVAALQISDRRALRLRDNLESVLLLASQRQQQQQQQQRHPIPVSEAIDKVREAVDLQQQQLQEAGDENVVWTVHPTLPPPHIGDGNAPASALRLPL
ncbi:hypothetical protein DQ04_04421010 [Trypanosoma grayi]|uniref:hypothetical protein n=1 Tax=Trypanosoma grayi TaxID=71804 RepID=UPI0004F46EFF|nr:hypothetical protein DQ04_04421010 [Trypanosoma grayi]KEG09933.1 hypothetical protein DQ04_04421010 [Trypanosoma grayi]